MPKRIAGIGAQDRPIHPFSLPDYWDVSTSPPEPAYVLIADAVVAGRQYVRGSLGPAGDFGPAFTRLLSAGLLIAFDPGRGMVEVRSWKARSNDEFDVQR